MRRCAILALLLAASSLAAQDSAGLYPIGRYSGGGQTAAEIVAWHAPSRTAFVINGHRKTVDIVKVAPTEGSFFMEPTSIDLVAAASSAGVDFGDVTSIAVSPDDSCIAVAVQHKDYRENGCVIFMDPAGTVIGSSPCGILPDMLTFTHDGKLLLVANEGEPRGGYLPSAGDSAPADPDGSVSIISVGKKKYALAATATFKGFSVESLRAAGAFIQPLRDKAGAITGYVAPEKDLEPEYIAVSADDKFAWVTLQEANAIAKLDIKKGKFAWVKGIPLKDYSAPGNELDAAADGEALLKSEPLYGLRMPDSIAAFSAKGKTFLAIANEGDGREWPILESGEADEGNPAYYKNELKASKIKESAISPALGDEARAFLALAREPDSPYAAVTLHAEASRDQKGQYDKLCIFGGRSFSILDSETLDVVFDSGSDFERLSAERYPEYFNASNDNLKIDSRSPKKGPEPEGVAIGSVGSRTYAFIGLERIGGIMVYDVTEPSKSKFMTYANSRDFSADIAGDSGPEGLCWIPADKSPSSSAVLLTANETSGTVAAFGAILPK